MTKMARNPTVGVFLTLAGVVAFGGSFGCTGVGRGPAVPKDLQDRAIVACMPNVRTWGDYVTPEFRGIVAEALRRKQARWAAEGHAERPPPAAVLAISGG